VRERNELNVRGRGGEREGGREGGQEVKTYVHGTAAVAGVEHGCQTHTSREGGDQDSLWVLCYYDIYIYIYMCVCVCLCLEDEAWRLTGTKEGMEGGRMTHVLKGEKRPGGRFAQPGRS
jgi:hypothetical protein